MTKEFTNSVAIFAEIEEFAGFSSESQCYIRKSLKIASKAPKAVKRSSRNPQRGNAIRSHADYHDLLAHIRSTFGQALTPKGESAFLAELIELSAFDLDSGDLDGFAPYRFLYERLLGACARPWLPSAFCAVALMPHVKPLRRIGMLGTLGEAAVAAWPETEPTFHPEKIAA